MITGTVINNGTNNGTQAGNLVTGGRFTQSHWAMGPLLDGAVVNNGRNNGTQAGNIIRGGRFRHF